MGAHRCVRENSGRLLCGLFLTAEPSRLVEGKMAIAGQSNQRKGTRNQSSQRSDEIRKVKIEGGKEKEKTVIVRRAIVREKGESTWSWHEEFVLEWSKTLIKEER